MTYVEPGHGLLHVDGAVMMQESGSWPFAKKKVRRKNLSQLSFASSSVLYAISQTIVTVSETSMSSGSMSKL